MVVYIRMNTIFLPLPPPPKKNGGSQVEGHALLLLFIQGLLAFKGCFILGPAPISIESSSMTDAYITPSPKMK